MAPENWGLDDKNYKNCSYQKNSDIFSIGMVFWELADGRGNLPWGESSIFQVCEYVIKEKKRPPIPPETPVDFAELITRCWRDSPLHRPGATDVFLKVQAMASASQVCSTLKYIIQYCMPLHFFSTSFDKLSWGNH